MKTAKKNDTANTNMLREQATAAIAAWREAQANAKTCYERYIALSRSNPLRHSKDEEENARVLDAAVRRYEAEDATLMAKEIASFALDEAERAEGDELAVAADLGTLRAGLTASIDEDRRLQTAITELRAARAARVRSTIDATASLYERRHRADLPPPVTVSNLADWSPEAIGQRIEAGPVPSNANAYAIDLARTQLRAKLIGIERAARDAEKKAKETAKEKALRAEETRDQQIKEHAKADAEARAMAKETQERDALLASARARVGLDGTELPSS